MRKQCEEIELAEICSQLAREQYCERACGKQAGDGEIREDRADGEECQYIEIATGPETDLGVVESGKGYHCDVMNN